ncbi:MAG: peptidoglycan-associated lipoprotein Pal [Gallionellaceae bacterium]
MKKLILSVVLINLLAGCAYFKKPVKATKSEAEPVATTPAATTAAEAPAVGGATTADVNAQNLPTTEVGAATSAAVAEAARAEATATAGQVDPMADPTSGLTKRSVYFPFDVDAIQESDKETIQAHGTYLGSHADRRVRAEGNADERGSSEYNLALGQRRANNTKKALVLGGAKSEQIEAISYGEERPQAVGHDETAWAQNRRADISYR